MARMSWVQCRKTGRLIPKDEYCAGNVHDVAPAVFGDMPAFQSPVDGTIVNGRADLRAHNRRNGVLLADDVRGLPPRQAVTEYKPDRAAIREAIQRSLYERG